jgi:putative transferase (TIGR04331 family)
MFLITTADEYTWKQDSKVLFLGEWCKLYSRKSLWSKLDYEVMPYHWEDRQRMHQDFQRINTIYERYLKCLADNMNNLHQCDHSIRYWRIIVGPWLYFFIEILYDRLLSIQSASDSNIISETIVFKREDKSTLLPQDFGHFMKLYVSDDWNGFIFDEIIKKFGTIPFREINKKTKIDVESKIESHTSISPKLILKSLINKIYPQKFNQIVFISSYFNRKDLIALQLSLGQWPNIVDPFVKTPNNEPDYPIRMNIKFEGSSTFFDEILEQLIPLQLPTAYIEGFSTLKKESLRVFPKNPKIIYTANAFLSNEGFKIWAAEKISQDAKLLIGQHGGHMGVALDYQLERHQISISDKFYTWGWQTSGDDKVKPLPGGGLVSFNNNVRISSNDGTILCVLANFPRYFCYMSSFPHSTIFLRYINDQIQFAKKLSVPAMELLKFRLDSSGKYGWDIEARLRDQGFANNIETRQKSLLKRLSECRICIATYNATVFIETFVANIPTMIFWRPEYNELRPSAKPYFDVLKQVGILHDSPDSAAALLNRICEDPLKWWNQEEIQNAKSKFCLQYANINNHWKSDWKAEIELVKFER